MKYIDIKYNRKMEKANYKKVFDIVDKILSDYGVIDPVVPIFDIVQGEGLDIELIEFPENIRDVSGIWDEQNKKIIVNIDDSPNRMFFTIAHELGHYMLKHPTNELNVLLRNTSLVSKNYLEKEANYFAANLLVPKKMLREKMQKLNLSKFDIGILAKIFGVSEMVMRYRIRSL